MKNNPLISIILTVRNEEANIKNCIDSILSFNLSNKLRTEIIIVDGMSNDNTRQIIKNINHSNIEIKLVDNHKIYQSFGFNIGLKYTKGNWVLWLGAHSVYKKDYLILAYNTAKRTGAKYVGGLINTLPYNSSYSANVVQAITTHIFGVGDSGFRIGTIEGPADTAAYGLFNKKIFSEIGIFDERLIRGQDYEFNRRIIATGGEVWLNPKMEVDYYNQPSMKAFLLKQLFKEAPYNAYMWYLAPYTFAYRHAITGVFATGVIGGILLSLFSPFIKYAFLSVMAFYFVLAFISSLQQAKRYKILLHIVTLPISFFLYHFIHGLGVLSGLIKLATRLSPVQKIKEPWKGYGLYRIKINDSLKK